FSRDWSSDVCSSDLGAPRQRIEQAELLQLVDGVRQQVDANPQRSQFLGAFVDAATDAALVQQQCQGEAADARAGDHDVHGLSPALSILLCTITKSPGRPHWD